MLELQKYLIENSPEKLQEELGIRVYRHPELPLLGFKYDQIDSPKTHPVVRECRGIVLEDKTWDVVAKPFNRFFNVGELEEEYKQFRWDDFYLSAKEDGSLIILYWYAGQWHINTSGSFGFGKQDVFGDSWHELFKKSVPNNLFEKLSEVPQKHTYVFELCTPYNKIVKTYKTCEVYLLTSSEKLSDGKWVENTEGCSDVLAEHLGVKRPERWNFKSQDEIRDFLLRQEENDPTFEGVVLRDVNNLRYKWKTSTYVSLHKLKDNGNILLPKNLVPLVLAGEVDEKKLYLPEISSALDEVSKIIDELWISIKELWEKNSAIKEQKDFALTIKEHPLSSILFMNRKANGDLESLKALFRRSDDMITKRVFGKTTFTFDGGFNEERIDGPLKEEA